LELLLPAFADYARQQPDALLVLAGADDGYEAEARAFIGQHNLADRIKLVGLLTGETKRAALADADVFALTSFSEGFSMAVLEAMAAGLPALVSDRVGFAEAIRQHGAAHITELTEASIRDGLTALLTNPDYRADLGQRAKTLVQTHYDIDVVAGQLLGHYADALARSRATR
jgi:glycosyltransferase involved in cell wall biosynthesis